MNIYEPIHVYDLTVLSASRDVLTRVKGGDDILTAVDEQYGWVGIGRPVRDPDDHMKWVCHVACSFAAPNATNTIPVTGRDSYDALKAAFELVDAALKLYRRAGRQVFFRDYGERGPEWIPDNDGVISPAIYEKLIEAIDKPPVARVHARQTEKEGENEPDQVSR